MLTMVAAWGIGESVIAATIVTIIEFSGLMFVFAYASPALSTIGTRWGELLPGWDFNQWTGILLGAYLAFYSFIGFEDMVNVAEEVKNPRRNLPRAILICVLITGDGLRAGKSCRRFKGVARTIGGKRSTVFPGPEVLADGRQDVGCRRHVGRNQRCSHSNNHGVTGGVRIESCRSRATLVGRGSSPPANTHECHDCRGDRRSGVGTLVSDCATGPGHFDDLVGCLCRGKRFLAGNQIPK